MPLYSPVSETISGKSLLLKDDRIESIIERESIPEKTEVIDCGGQFYFSRTD